MAKRTNLKHPTLYHNADSDDQKAKDVTRNLVLKNIVGNEIISFEELNKQQNQINNTLNSVDSISERLQTAVKYLGNAADLMSQLTLNTAVAIGKGNEVQSAMQQYIPDPEIIHTNCCDVCYSSYDPNLTSCSSCQDHCQGCVAQQNPNAGDCTGCVRCDSCQGCYSYCDTCNTCQSCFSSCERNNYCTGCNTCQTGDGCVGCDQCNVKYAIPACTSCDICQGCNVCEKYDVGTTCGASNNDYTPCVNCGACFASYTHCNIHYGSAACTGDNTGGTAGTNVDYYGCYSNYNCYTSQSCSSGYEDCKAVWADLGADNLWHCKSFHGACVNVDFVVPGCTWAYDNCTAKFAAYVNDADCFVSYNICMGCYSCYNPDNSFRNWDPCLSCHSSCFICNVACNQCQQCNTCVSCYGSCNTQCNSCQGCYSSCQSCVSCQGCNMCNSCNTCQEHNSCDECQRCQGCFACERCNSSCVAGCYFNDRGDL